MLGFAGDVKIVFVIRSLNCAGAERQMVMLAAGLRQKGHEVNVIAFYGDGFYESYLKLHGVPLSVAGKRNRWDLLAPSLRVLKLLRTLQPDIIHSYMGLANITIALLKSKMPKAKVVWGIRGTDIDARDYNWLSGFGVKFENALAKRADLIISNSRAGAAAVRDRGYPAERVKVIPNGFDPADFHIDREARTRIRAQWGIREDELVIGRVGRLDPQKDYPTFLRAASIIAQNPNVRFVCIGAGSPEYLGELQKLAETLNIQHRTLWLGFVAQMREAYNGLDLMVSSSQYGEGFPNVILEAMACGVPCVSTRVGDSAEVLGEFGQSVDRGDVRGLADSCVQLLKMLPSREAVATSVYNRFRLEKLISEVEDTLKRLLPERADSSSTANCALSGARL